MIDKVEVDEEEVGSGAAAGKVDDSEVVIFCG